MRTGVALAAFTAAALFIFGCAKSNPNRPSAANSGKFYAVVADTTAFYHYGPQQANGPDKKLPRDALMTLIHPSFGYAKVRLAAGSEEGFVASDDIRPAPATLVAAVTATPTPIPHIDYPEPKLPTSEPAPNFEPTPIPGPSISPN